MFYKWLLQQGFVSLPDVVEREWQSLSDYIYKVLQNPLFLRCAKGIVMIPAIGSVEYFVATMVPPMEG